MDLVGKFEQARCCRRAADVPRLFCLSNEAWAAIDPHLPRGKPGKPRVDDRRVIRGILHVLKIGCR
jgi:transposase